MLCVLEESLDINEASDSQRTFLLFFFFEQENVFTKALTINTFSRLKTVLKMINGMTDFLVINRKHSFCSE